MVLCLGMVELESELYVYDSDTPSSNSNTI